MKITKQEIEQIRVLLQAAPGKLEYQRIQCVWMGGALGLTSKQISIAIGWNAGSVRRIQALYRRLGTDAFDSAERGGRRRQNMSLQQEADLLKPFLRYTRVGFPLNIQGVKTAYERAVKRPVPKSTVYRLIRRHGLGSSLRRRRVV